GRSSPAAAPPSCPGPSTTTCGAMTSPPARNSGVPAFPPAARRRLPPTRGVTAGSISSSSLAAMARRGQGRAMRSSPTPCPKAAEAILPICPGRLPGSAQSPRYPRSNFFFLFDTKHLIGFSRVGTLSPTVRPRSLPGLFLFHFRFPFPRDRLEPELQPGLVGAADMFVDGGIGRISVPGLDGADDRRMLLDRRLAPPRGRDRGMGHEGHRPVHHLELLDQVAVVAGEMDLAMEPLVGPAEKFGPMDQFAV